MFAFLGSEEGQQEAVLAELCVCSKGVSPDRAKAKCSQLPSHCPCHHSRPASHLGSTHLGKNFPSNCRKQHFNIVASTSASFLQCQGFGLELLFISGPDSDDPRGSTSWDELPSDQNSRVASSCGSDRTSIFAPGSREV